MTELEQKINLNQFEKIVTTLQSNNNIIIEPEYNINMGNDSYYKIVTTEDIFNWDLFKINKKSKNIIKKHVSYQEIFEVLLDYAINKK